MSARTTSPGRMKSLYEVSLVKSFAVGQERFFLTFFPTGGTFEQVPAFMSRQPTLLGGAERSSPSARKGCAGRRKGLTAQARAEQ
jgi:hypothetical protein